MSSSKSKTFLKKIFSLLSVIRGYNILVLVVAQYLASIFIFSPERALQPILFDYSLHIIIFATICVVASGYIINNFYDVNLDKINRPIKTGIDNYVKQSTKLRIYFFLNFLAFVLSLTVSIRAALFFAVYIFGIWFYSHKLKRYPFTGIVVATILTVLPFFAVFVHFKNFSTIIFVHAIFLFLVLMVRELIKDLQGIKGAIANNYKTFPVVYGEQKTKRLCYVLLLLSIVPVVVLFSYPAMSYMRYYFYFTLLVLLFVGFKLRTSKDIKQYTFLHNVLKFLLLIGVFSLIFIDPSLLLEKVINKLN